MCSIHRFVPVLPCACLLYTSGVGLAMDAFSVSMANGLHDPQMSRRRGVQIAGTFAIFQAVMPMTGWVCVHTIVELFSSFEKFSPWIALKMCIRDRFQDEVVRRRTQYDLKKAKERAHILEGLKKATDIVDELIATIRACKGGMAEAKAAIMLVKVG